MTFFIILLTSKIVTMVVNRQREVSVDLAATREFVRRLRRTLGLGPRDFNVCFVGDREIARLNATYRGNERPTDILSFPWRAGARYAKFETRNLKSRISNFEFRNLLGDIVISVPAAKRNARAEGHSMMAEIRWLILHGALHLLGYDHETDNGKMARLEHELREQLGP